MRIKSFLTLSLVIMAVFSAKSSNFESKTGGQNLPNAATATFAVSGNCGMCKKSIETAVNKKGVAAGSWNVDTKVLSLTYNSKKTTPEEILKRVAYAGYDNPKFLAPDEAYAKLHECCQYERSKLAANTSNAHNHEGSDNQSAKGQQTKNQLEPLYSAYFAVKDALVKDNAALASTKAKELLNALNAVKMESLSSDEHTVFMNHLSDLKMDAGHINESKDIDHQREHFGSLSKNLYGVMKKIKPDYTVYLDHCPMFNDGKGANWISKESAVKNPYYGAKMLTCGKVAEALK